jgi:hypothetical protein
VKIYDLKDQTTVYFVISEHSSNNEIKAWSDDKMMAQFYMEFHNCKRYRLRVVKKIWKEMVKIINDNSNDEIEIMNLVTKSDDKKDDGYKIIQVPMTTTEMSIISDTVKHNCATLIDYSEINQYITLFKKKYQKSFKNIGLIDIIRKEIYNKPTKFTNGLRIDDLRILFKLFKEDFD